MERKGFLKSLLVSAVSTSVLAQACKKDPAVSPSESSTTSTGATTGTTGTTGTTTTGGSTGSGCTVAPTETEGPFPTKSPASYVRSDITDGRTGYKMTVKLIITNASCNALQNALVDIWHCDKDGNYSEYGGSGMQATNYTAVHFLRGRQVTDSNGLVTFTSIFPGWYSGRATHIHVHVYNASGTSLKITQIAFPEGTGSAVAAVNGYSKGMSGYTLNANDNVFSDGYATELASVTGNTTDGFVLTMSIAVPA